MLAILGAVLTMGLGILGLFAPERAAQLVRIKPLGKMGLSEVRATYGGLFLGLSLCVLIMSSREVNIAVGFAFAGAVLGRVFSIIYDRAHERENWGGVILEGSIAALFLLD